MTTVSGRFYFFFKIFFCHELYLELKNSVVNSCTSIIVSEEIAHKENVDLLRNRGYPLSMGNVFLFY